MPVAIDQVDVESAPAAGGTSPPPAEPAQPDPREIERALEVNRERIARVRAH